MTIILALSGVPLALLCLGTLGRVLQRCVDSFWHHCIMRKKARQDNVEHRLPLVIGLVIVLAWILIVSGYFVTFSRPNFDHDALRFNYFDALYFAVVSMFTIGFGDYAPTRRSLDLVTFLLLFVGLALVSMCVAITQKRMESQMEQIISRIQQVYRQGKVLLGPHGTPQAICQLTSEESKVAGIVVEMWKADPSGKWLGVLLNTDVDKSKREPPRIGRMMQKLIVEKWKRKTFNRLVATQTDANVHPESHPVRPHLSGFMVDTASQATDPADLQCRPIQVYPITVARNAVTQ